MENFKEFQFDEQELFLLKLMCDFSPVSNRADIQEIESLVQLFGQPPGNFKLSQIQIDKLLAAIPTTFARAGLTFVGGRGLILLEEKLK